VGKEEEWAFSNMVMCSKVP